MPSVVPQPIQKVTSYSISLKSLKKCLKSIVINVIKKLKKLIIKISKKLSAGSSIPLNIVKWYSKVLENNYKEILIKNTQNISTSHKRNKYSLSNISSIVV
jgi:hypothetical protein